MIERLTAVFLAFAMLHINVARVDAMCGMHEHAAAAATEHAGMEHHDGAPIDETPCDTPASPDCCQALTSCAPILGTLEGSTVAVTAAIVPATITAAVTERPLSRSTAPEPPPPKA